MPRARRTATNQPDPASVPITVTVRVCAMSGVYRTGRDQTSRGTVHAHTTTHKLLTPAEAKCRLYADLCVITAEELRSVVRHSRVGLPMVRKRPWSLFPAQIPLVSLEFLSIRVRRKAKTVLLSILSDDNPLRQLWVRHVIDSLHCKLRDTWVALVLVYYRREGCKSTILRGQGNFGPQQVC